MNMAYGNTLMFQQRPPMAGCNKFRLHLTVMAFAHDPQTGELREIQTLSTLPAEVTERKGFSGAEIVVHPSGRFLYASNRGHDTIAMFAVDDWAP